MLNLPNLLSLGRIVLVPILVVVLLTKFENKEWWGLGLFLVASLTDFLDGFLARRRQQETRLGKLLDPAADKILMAAAFISLVELNPATAPAWMVVAIIAREFAVSALRSFAASEGIIIAAGFWGKVKTVVHVIAISLLIIHDKLLELRDLAPPAVWVAPVFLWVALAISMYSGVHYFIRFGRLILYGEHRFGGEPERHATPDGESPARSEAPAAARGKV